MSPDALLDIVNVRPDPRLLTEREAAQYLRVSPETLRRYRRARRLGHVRVGRKPFYTIAQLERFIARNVVPALGDRRAL